MFLAFQLLNVLYSNFLSITKAEMIILVLSKYGYDEDYTRFLLNQLTIKVSDQFVKSTM